MAKIVGHDPIRAIVVRNPGPFDFEIFGKFVNLDGLAMKDVLRAPSQILGLAVRIFSARIIDQSIGFDRANERQLERVDQDHQIFGRVPRVHQHRPQWQALLRQGPCEHFTHMIELAFAVPFGIKQTIIDDPILAALGVDIQTIDHSNAFDQSVGVATVLEPNQIDMMRVILVDDGVVEDETTIGRSHDITLDVFPNQAGRQFIPTQQSIDRIVTESATVICEIRHGEIDVTGAKKLAII